MSGKSCASGSVRSCAGSVRLGTASGHEVVLDALYERKRDKKSVRVLTVIIYVFCVSLAAIMLSLYYVFFWEPKDAQYAQRKVSHTVTQQTSTTPMPTCLVPDTGSGNITVNPNSTESFQANLLEPIYESTREHSGSDLTTNLTTEAASMLETTHEDSDSYDVGPDNNTNTIT
ncbi:unnamed protein product [Parnassius apollo]|uniref:(apollo) hypothetical protein n=1 Tax=Parnassius apollo TaxID=110799 RepID=A0A8S3WE49_PARAO|nr:unnamed protein product [Parnassius apollo]